MVYRSPGSNFHSRHNTDRTEEIYKCTTYCPSINSNSSCTEYYGNEDILDECNAALSHCDCRPAWKQPVVWLIIGVFILAFLWALRNFVVGLMNRNSRIGRHTVVSQPVVGNLGPGYDSSNVYSVPQQYAAPMDQYQHWNAHGAY